MCINITNTNIITTTTATTNNSHNIINSTNIQNTNRTIANTISTDHHATVTAPPSSITRPTHSTHLNLKMKTHECEDAETISDKKPCSLSSSTTTLSSTNAAKAQLTKNNDCSPSTIPTDITTAQTGETRSRPELNTTAKKPRIEIDSTKSPSDCGFESHRPANWNAMSKREKYQWRQKYEKKP